MGLLSIGIERIDITLTDSPEGCLRNLDAAQREETMRSFLYRDFHNTSASDIPDEFNQICNMRVYVSNGQGAAEFTYTCCKRDAEKRIKCADIVEDAWVATLIDILKVAIVVLLLYFPKFIRDFMYLYSEYSAPYISTLPEDSSLVIEKRGDTLSVSNVHGKMELQGMSKVKEVLDSYDDGAIKCRVADVTLSVPHSRLLSEDTEPVSLPMTVYDGIFRCRIAHTAALAPCCSAPMCNDKCSKCCTCRRTWIWMFGLVASLLHLFLFTIPTIVQYVVYVSYLKTMEDEKYEAMDRVNGTFVQQHMFDVFGFGTSFYRFIAVGLAIVCGFIVKFFFDRWHSASRLFLIQSREHGSISVLSKTVQVCLTPFKEYGILGCVVFPIYIPKILLFVLYSIVLIIPFAKILMELVYFPTKFFIDEMRARKLRIAFLRRAVCENVLYLLICYLLLFSLVIWISDCVTFYTEVFFYTLTGIIANANRTLPLLTIILPVGVYTRQMLRDVKKLYTDFSKMLKHVILSEQEIKIKEINPTMRHKAIFMSDFSSCLSDNIVECFEERTEPEEGIYYNSNSFLIFTKSFKEARMEMFPLTKRFYDEIIPLAKKGTWKIRVYTPSNMFFEIVDLDLPGGPGTIRYTLLKACARLLTVYAFLTFVVIVVMGLGDTYKLSLMDQFMLTIVGGLIPLIFRYGIFNFDMRNVEDNKELNVNLVKAIQLYTERWQILDMSLTVIDSESAANPGDVVLDEGHETDQNPPHNHGAEDSGVVFIPMHDLAPVLKAEEENVA